MLHCMSQYVYSSAQWSRWNNTQGARAELHSEHFTHLYLLDVHFTFIIIKKAMTKRNVNYECPIL